MDKYLIANILVWMAIIALGWQMHTKQRPCKLTLRGGFIFFVLALYWGDMMGLPPYMTSRIGYPYEWEGLLFVLIMSAVIGGVLYLITKWIRVTWVRLVILAAIIITASLKYNWPFYYFPGVSGRVVDMDTGNGIKDAVVKAEVMACIHASLGGPVSGPIRVISALTNSEGEYRIGRSLDIAWWPLTKMTGVKLEGMHILTAQTTKRIGAPQMWPAHEDIQLMDAKKYFEAFRWKSPIPAMVGLGNYNAPEEMVGIMLRNGVSKATIRTYYDDVLKARKVVYGEDDPYARDWPRREEWFR